MTKPTLLALGIGACAAFFAALAGAADGAARWLCAWVALACALASLAYALNLPGIFGKREGRLRAWRVLPLLPFLAAYWIACGLWRRRRRGAPYHEVAPGLWVGIRLPAAELPRGTGYVLDLTSELPAAADVAALPGYRCVPVLDGHVPADVEAFLDVVEELAAVAAPVYVHCESGKGRAPTAAALVLIARGAVDGPAAALEQVRKGRPVAAPTRSDVAFVHRTAGALECLCVESLHIFSQCFHPGTLESALKTDKTIAIQTAHDRGGIELLCLTGRS